MIQYEQLRILTEKPQSVNLRTQYLPELVHLEDQARTVMCDFRLSHPPLIHPGVNMDDAISEMKATGSHLLLVVSEDNSLLLGLISSEDLLGEKPIRLLSQNRLGRKQLPVKALMIPVGQCLMLHFDDVQNARVGNIVNTMKAHHSHYALVIQPEEQTGHTFIRGLFNTSQISKQLHTDVANRIAKAQSVSELKDRL